MIKRCGVCSADLKTVTRMHRGTTHVLQVCTNCNFEAPANYLKVNEIWAYLSVDPTDGNEGVIAAPIGSLTMPLIGADKERMISLKPIAEELAKRSGIEIKLVKFSRREVVETIKGK
jgi:hypothetical protein